nr:MAG TPA: hypothetical protein [Caudoviricetes sp.]
MYLFIISVISTKVLLESITDNFNDISPLPSCN